MSSESRIRIGVLTRTYGLAGGLRCTLDVDAVPTVATPCEGWTGYSAAFLEPIRLERYEERGKELIIYFAGIKTPEDATRLTDRALFLPVEVLSYKQPLSNPLLIGYDVQDETGRSLGRIDSIFRTPAHFIWQVSLEEKEWMVPAIEEFVVEVRHAERIAVVRPIPGMVIDEPEEHDSAE